MGENGEDGYYVDEYTPPGRVTNVQEMNDDGTVENSNPSGGSSDPYGEPASTAGGRGGGLDYDEETSPYTSDGSNETSDSDSV
ncbi:hypothetical protein TRICI_005108 [Trichomonascus ciferrii]|uniref:Uncharacterized protein n=1 Tax=Trichomonascus ciferrii TaxID=44093 RepID=A0A642V2Q2_9ASCO|nr:hypothetical protein TRICI_005108 [Trichomonascus ciferrii]